MEHSEIPEGDYCYRSLEVIEDPNGGPPTLKMEMCPHWHKTEKGASCDLINEEHTELCMYHLLWDQVKECGINKEKYIKYPTDRSDWIPKETVCYCGKTLEILVKPKKSLL